MSACHNGHLDCVKLLVDYDADLNLTVEGNYLTAMMLATRNGHEECAEFLGPHVAGCQCLNGLRKISGSDLEDVYNCDICDIEIKGDHQCDFFGCEICDYHECMDCHTKVVTFIMSVPNYLKIGAFQRSVGLRT